MEYPKGWDKNNITKKALIDIFSRYGFLLNQFKNLLIRDFTKYRTIPIIMWLTWLWSSYWTHRALDDFADGDNKLPEWMSMEDFFQSLIHITNNLHLAKSPLELNLRHSIITLSNKLTPQDDPDYIKTLYLQFFEAMKTDYNRRKDGTIFNQEQLDTIIRDSFHSSIEIMLIWIGSKQRISDLWDLWLLQWKMYSLRDLESDLSNNIFNIPLELFLETTLTKEEIKEDINQFVKLEATKKRMINELKICREIIDTIDNIEKDKKAELVVKFITKSWIQKLFPLLYEKYNLIRGI